MRENLIFCNRTTANRGASLIELMIAAAVMGILLFTFLMLQTNQLYSNNYLEFQMKRTQLQTTLLGQFLYNPDNCKCLFQGAAQFPVAGTAALTGVAPTQIGRYNFVTAGVCATATVPVLFVNNVGLDGLRSSAIGLRNIVNVGGGAYAGEFFVTLQSTKRVAGPGTLEVQIPVNVAVTPGAPGNVIFDSCATIAPSVLQQTSMPLASCGTAPVRTFLPCPVGTRPISCGLEDLTQNPREDFAGCYIDIPGNRCVAQRDQNGSGCDPINFHCYCLP